MNDVLLIKNGLESAMSHCISQNLVVNPQFDVEWYLHECRSVFVSVGIDDMTIEDMVDEARDRGLMEYVTGLTVAGVDAGAQLHPSANPHIYSGAERLAALLKQYI